MESFSDKSISITLWKISDIGSFGAFLCGIGILYVIARSIYNLYFHPLSSFPGPKAYSATILPYVYSLLRGRLCFDVQKFHEKYGDVVRIGPNELSYSNPEAWVEIYGHRQGKENMQKEEIMYSPPLYGPKSIITADDTTHARYRRLLAHAFSDRALRGQEELMTVYVDLLIRRLHENCQSGTSPVNMVKWYNFTTFDMIGDLSFGESFHCLENSSYHPWVSMMFGGVKANSYYNGVKRFPAAEPILSLFMPKKVMAAKEAHTALVIEKVRQRLAMVTDRSDFTSFILRNQDKDPLTEKELQANADILIIAGSETTATLLSGVTYYLCKNPRVMKTLCEEIRAAFSKDEEINIIACNGLKYMLAVLEEALRIYPPSPSGFPRIVPGAGEVLSGRFVAGGTAVSVNPWAAYHSPRNFKDPNSFVPERFLGDDRYASDKRSALQPFAVGPRNCLGRNLAYSEMRLILARVLFNFDMKLASDSEDWVEKQKVYVLWEKGHLNVYLTPVAKEKPSQRG